jgi:hypothetical protein
VTHPQTSSLLPVAPEGVRWTPISFEVVDPTLSLERLEVILRGVGQIKTATSLWIGDAIIFAETRWGERYEQAMHATGLSYSTLTNYVYVCSHVPRGRRRKAYEDGRWQTLRFGHFEAVARLEPSEQDRWLNQADERGWTRDELRDAIRTAGALPPANGEAKSEGQISRGRQNLDGASVVEASRELGVILEALTMTRDALEGATVAGLEESLPGAFRALEEVGQTVRVAAARMAGPSLVDAAREVVRSATRSSGFAMVPVETFERFRTAVEQEDR